MKVNPQTNSGISSNFLMDSILLKAIVHLYGTLFCCVFNYWKHIDGTGIVKSSKRDVTLTPAINAEGHEPAKEAETKYLLQTSSDVLYTRSLIKIENNSSLIANEFIYFGSCTINSDISLILISLANR